MKFYSIHGIPFVAIVVGSLHLAAGSQLQADASLSKPPSPKQVCGGHKWFTEHPCPAGREARYNGHWDCCTFLTDSDKTKTDERRAKDAHKHDTSTDHGRCLGKTYITEPKCHFSDTKSKEFSHPKVADNGKIWDCCKSLTSAEDQDLAKYREMSKHACHGYGFEYEDKPYVMHKHSCEKGKYAKLRDGDPSRNWKYKWHLLCCPEFTEEEKRIGDRQRWEASEEAKAIEKKHADMRADDDARRARRQRNKALCESSHYGNRKK